MADAIIAGHLCLDIIPELPSGMVFQPGSLVEAGAATLSTGGVVSNTGRAMVILGSDVRLMGKVGDDLFGKAVLEILGGHAADIAVASGESTSYTIVLSLLGEDRMFLHAPGCNATFRSADVPTQSMNGARLLHFGYPPLMRKMFADEGAELDDLLRRAKEQGLTTSLDMSLPDSESESGRADWTAILRRVLPLTDLFTPSVEELRFMLRTPEASPVEMAARCLAMGCRAVALKAGSKGLYLHSAASFESYDGALPDTWRNVDAWIPCFQVRVTGTTGAGDATVAGLLHGLLDGMDPISAVRLAVATGACCCEQVDAVSGVLPLARTLERMEGGWPSVDPGLGPEWTIGEDGAYRR